MKTLFSVLAGFAVLLNTGSADDNPLWDLATDTIPAELQSGNIKRVGGKVSLKDGAAFAVPAAAFPDQKNFTVQVTFELTDLIETNDDDPFILHPGEFVLGSTLERVEVPDDLVARLEGKSSLGRLGLLIHSTAGFVDAGFSGQLTLELSNVANLPITLYPGMKIGQISFQQMTTPAERPYGSGVLRSKYHGQRGPMPSRYWENFG